MNPYLESPLVEEEAALVAAVAEYDSGIGVVKAYSGIGIDSGDSVLVQFPDLLTHLMREKDSGKGWSTYRLAAESGTSQSSVAKAMTGDAPPPLAHLPKWADALGLKGAGREAFIQSGEMAKAKAKRDVAHTVLKIEDELRQLHDEVEALESIVSTLVPFLLTLKQLGVDIPAEVAEALRAARKLSKT